MPAYTIRSDVQADGLDPVDAAIRALSVLRYRTGRITFQVRADREDADWEPVVITIPGIGI